MSNNRIPQSPEGLMIYRSDEQAKLEQDGIVFGLAQATVQALREIADTATPERFIKIVVKQLTDAGEVPTAERVAAHLHTTLGAIKAGALELQWAESAGRA
ncbi:MAG: hypothetical protein QM739_04275 [Propionivibrio sp.]